MAGFADLPPEIRAIIWEFCLPGPRTVVVKRLRHTRAPVVFHICRESREEAQRHSYELAFSVPYDGGLWMTWHRLDFNGRPVIWFNFLLDRLCLESIVINPDECYKSFRRVRSLGLTFPLKSSWSPFWDIRYLGQAWFLGQTWLNLFPRLEEIAVFRAVARGLENDLESEFFDMEICKNLRAAYWAHPSNEISAGAAILASKIWYRSYDGRFGDLTTLTRGYLGIYVYRRDIENTT
ncbi:uncharacterized protein GGS22DRAFT_163584 [Annulohypoxylon maeteangense]|uniref:uncharacterized protein n=1 Tax=Annulohypoxylon maeteangense TaxID=1927788 RepID=UPI002008567B|nr:uncharacterized protein GGS22DRAFT_163584 [Annulohypoxylon maeteangense]KAI0885386.1 hypothetical protein GGS22DRAFT_163584 [Annulohypoxylon maeteangense]